MKIDMDIAKQIENINFFERCGFNDRENLSLNHSFSIIKSTDSIDDKSIRYDWDNVCQDAMNDITSYLHHNYCDVLNHEWNPLVKEIRENIMPPISEIISAKCTTTSFSDREELINSIKANIMDIIIAASMKDYYKSDFYEDMLKIYESGHIACGWTGSRSYGKFKIY